MMDDDNSREGSDSEPSIDGRRPSGEHDRTPANRAESGRTGGEGSDSTSPQFDRRRLLQGAADGSRPWFVRAESSAGESTDEGESSITSRIGSTTRRGALRALGAGAFLGSDLLGAVRGANPKMVDVPELLSGNTVVEYMEVPEDWLQHRNHAREAKRNLLDRIGDRPYVFDLGLTGGDATYGGATGFKIRVRVTDTTKASALPDRVDEIPVAVEPTPESHGFGGCHNANDEEYAAGGEAVGWEGHGFGTATTGVIHENKSETHLLHCAHVFWSDCDDAKSGGLEGRDAYRGTSFTDTTSIGQVTGSWDRKGDYAVIEPDGDSTFYRYIDENDDYPDVVGCLSENKIDWLGSNDDDEPILKMGVTNGKNYGDVVASDVSFTFTCINFRDEGVEATTDFGNGDSGGPTYLLRNGDAYISHVSSYRYYDRGAVDGCDHDDDEEIKVGNAVGTAGYYIRNNEPIKFDPDQ